MNRIIGWVAAGLLGAGTVTGAQTSSDTRGHQPGHEMTQMNEREFVTMMLQHHQDGIDMARIAEQKATTPQVRTLARKIREGQEREARELKPFADTRETSTPRGTSGRQEHAAHAQEHQAHMQQSKNAIDRVRSATGKAVDQAFLEEMTKHHEMAVRMTRNTRFENTRLKGMADKMAANQTREIDELTRTRQRVG